MMIFSCELWDPIIEGCMTSTACNYKPDASEEDGSCDYDKYNDYYCQSNLNVLQDFIDNSSNSVGGYSTDHTLNLDMLDLGYDGIGGTNDDGEGDGIIEPVELARNDGGQRAEWNAGRLVYWDCNDCGLSGNIPENIVDLNMLNYLDLSNNLLSGEIPENFGNMSQLTNINLSNNYLSGNLADNFIDFFLAFNLQAIRAIVLKGIGVKIQLSVAL